MTRSLPAGSLCTPVTRQSAVTLVAPAAGWEARTPMVSLVSGIRYHLGGGSSDNEGATEDVTFDLADLAKLAPGQILFQRGNATHQVADLDAMRAQVCE